MSKLLETLREDFLITVENNGDIIIFDNELLGEPLTIDMLNDEDNVDAAWLADLNFENGEIVDWVIRSATALDIERTKYLNEILSPTFKEELNNVIN